LKSEQYYVTNWTEFMCLHLFQHHNAGENESNMIALAGHMNHDRTTQLRWYLPVDRKRQSIQVAAKIKDILSTQSIPKGHHLALCPDVTAFGAVQQPTDSTDVQGLLISDGISTNEYVDDVQMVDIGSDCDARAQHYASYLEMSSAVQSHINSTSIEEDNLAKSQSTQHMHPDTASTASSDGNAYHCSSRTSTQISMPFSDGMSPNMSMDEVQTRDGKTWFQPEEMRVHGRRAGFMTAQHINSTSIEEDNWAKSQSTQHMHPDTASTASSDGNAYHCSSRTLTQISMPFSDGMSPNMSMDEVQTRDGKTWFQPEEMRVHGRRAGFMTAHIDILQTVLPPTNGPYPLSHINNIVYSDIRAQSLRCFTAKQLCDKIRYLKKIKS